MFCMVFNQKVGTKCAACDIGKPWNEVKLDVYVSVDGGESLAYSIIRSRSFKFGVLGL